MSETPGRHLLRLFVYGTLKHGERNHDRFCQGASAVEAATARGRLYDLPFGFPALVVPKEDVHAVGTGDYLGDAELSRRTPATPLEGLEGWDEIRGELLLFDDPEKRLPEVDGLEGFRPGVGCFYTRVLVPVTTVQGGETVLAWAYSIAEGSGVRLPGGIWPAHDARPG